MKWRTLATGPRRPNVTRPGLRNAPKFSAPSLWSSRVTSVFPSLHRPDLSRSSPTTSAPHSTVSQASYQIRDMELPLLVEHPSVMDMEPQLLEKHPSVTDTVLQLLVELPLVMMNMVPLYREDPPSIIMDMEVHLLIMMNMELL